MGLSRAIDELKVKREEQLKRKESLLLELTEIEESISSFDLAISRLEEGEDLGADGSVDSEKIMTTMTPTQAVAYIFGRSSSRLSPGQLRDKLEKLRDRGLLASDAQNLLFATHNAIQALLKRGEIRPAGKDGRVVFYRRVAQR